MCLLLAAAKRKTKGKRTRDRKRTRKRNRKRKKEKSVATCSSTVLKNKECKSHNQKEIQQVFFRTHTSKKKKHVNIL